MLAVQGPRARAILAELADGVLPPRLHCCQRALAGVPMLVCGTGYTGEDGVELLLDPAQAATVWDALIAAGATPAGLGARDTLRLEVCFHLYGNDLSEERGPIEAGLGWCCKEQTGFIGVRERSPGRAPRAPPSGCGVRDRGLRDRAPGQPGRRRRRRDQRDVLAMPETRYRDGLRSGRPRRAGDDARDRRARARRARPWCTRSRSTRRRRDHSGRSQLPRRSALPRRARLGPDRSGDEATFGITWYAQDSLGEVVFFDPPAVGTPVQGLRLHRGRVGQGRLRRDRPAVGRDRRGQRDARRQARDDQRGPVRRGLAGQGQAVRPLRAGVAAGRGRVRGDADCEQSTRPPPTPTAAEMLAAIGVESIEELFADIPPALRLAPAAGARRRAVRAGGLRRAARARRAQRRAPRTSSRSSAPACTTTMCRRWSTRSSSARSS